MILLVDNNRNCSRSGSSSDSGSRMFGERREGDEEQVPESRTEKIAKKLTLVHFAQFSSKLLIIKFGNDSNPESCQFWL